MGFWGFGVLGFLVPGGRAACRGCTLHAGGGGGESVDARASSACWGRGDGAAAAAARRGAGRTRGHSVPCRTLAAAQLCKAATAWASHKRAAARCRHSTVEGLQGSAAEGWARAGPASSSASRHTSAGGGPRRRGVSPRIVVMLDAIAVVLAEECHTPAGRQAARWGGWRRRCQLSGVACLPAAQRPCAQRLAQPLGLLAPPSHPPNRLHVCSFQCCLVWLAGGVWVPLPVPHQLRPPSRTILDASLTSTPLSVYAAAAAAEKRSGGPRGRLMVCP